ncbi:MAG: NAD(P)-binding domain-containing protein [Candidatus Nanopelagicales bacterium]
MRIGMLGTGMVGTTVGARLVKLGHEVRLGSRASGGEAATAWADAHGERASQGTFAEAAGFGELIINATRGEASLAALDLAGAEQLDGKVLVDIANPLDFSRGFPPTVDHPGGLSLGERIQARFPHAAVVKALNTVNADVMADPAALAEPTTVFVAGDDEAAKATVTGLLVQLGWLPDQVVDVGDITAAGPLELYLPLWVRLMQVQGTARFNVRLVR